MPVTCNDGSNCSIVVNSEVGQEMETVDLFVLNEASIISCLLYQEVITWVLRAIASKVQTPRMCASNSSPAKHQAFTWTGSIQQFPTQLGSTRLPTNQEPPFQSLYSNSQPACRRSNGLLYYCNTLQWYISHHKPGNLAVTSWRSNSIF